MIFANVRLPDDVRVALQDDRLVIFAGAGVSLAAPSSLPLFNALACEICGSNVIHGKEDRELGKAARNGTDVHALAARRLYNDNTHPTELHRHILRLFGTASKLRIVTTNFDNHFSAAARTVYKNCHIPEYCGPALPLGDDFHGIVYLHGSARLNPTGMVLTDKNFGQAYLTRGWARDFLVALFSQYNVLFVGYSHNDVTTSYLARGLNEGQVKRRWALVSSNLKSDAEENWKHLDINILQYPIDPSNANNPHQALTDFFSEWTKHNRESLLYRSKKITAIAAALPPETQTASEYLDYCLHHPQLAKDFCAAIRHPAWFGWMHAHKYFENFFCDTSSLGSKQQLDDHERVIGHWLTTFVRRKFPELLLELVESRNQRLSRPFAESLAHAILTDQRKFGDRKYSMWISLLLSQGEQVVSQHTWAYLLQNCRIPEDTFVALRLFDLITSPQLHLRKHIPWSEIAPDEDTDKKTCQKKVDFEIDWPEASKHTLKEAWEKVISPNLAHLAEPLALIVTKQLTFAHLLLRAVGNSVESLGWHRNAIASHEQNRGSLYECLSVLVDAARDILLYWHKVDPSRAQGQIDTWWSSNQLLLQRLATYGVATDPRLSNDNRIDWLLKNDLIFAIGFKKEVFDVLAISYSGLSERAKQKLLKRIARGHKGKIRKKLGPDTIAYEQFNLLVWLRRADSACQLVRTALAKIRESYPHFAEREHPDFDHWIEEIEFGDRKQGFNFEKILSEPPANYLDECLRAAETNARRDRWIHLENLKHLFCLNRDWGRGFMEALATKEANSTLDIWNSVFSAWRDVAKSSEDWAWILEAFRSVPKNGTAFAGVARVISHGLFEQREKVDPAIISDAASLMDEAWDICSAVDETPDDSFHEWLTSAINHEGGWIAEFWIHYCSHLREQARDQWSGIPEQIKVKMRDAVSGNTRVKVYARIAMTPWIGYIFAWDKDFAIDSFLPLLDWKRDPVVAQQSWSVLLNYRRRTSVEMEEQLLPYYKQVAERMTAILKDATEKADQFAFDAHASQNFGYYLAGVAMKVLQNPLESGFFRDFLPKLPDKVRGSLADGMGDFLRSASTSMADNVWEHWLREYVDLRLLGVPTALSFDETKAMAGWCLHVDNAFPELVQRVVQMRLKNIFAYGIIEKLLKNPVLSKFPREACRFLNAILNAEEHPFLHDAFSTLHIKFKETISGTTDFQTFEELLYLRGWKR